MPVKIKICGVTRKEDALLACELGAHAIGFVFAGSPRRVDPETAAEIAEALPTDVKKVGVFLGQSLPVILKIANVIRLNALQIYDTDLLKMLIPQDTENLKDTKLTELTLLRHHSYYMNLNALELEIIPAFFVRNSYSVNRIKRSVFPQVLLDRSKNGNRNPKMVRLKNGKSVPEIVQARNGETDPAIVWRAARLLHYTKKVILAGGLDPDNVQDAILFAHPHCVDVARGVESEPGVKDPEKMRRFFRKVEEAGDYF